MFQIEENIENSIGKITLENNNLSTKLFLAEQELSKKSTTISLLKKKIINSKNKFYKDEEEYYIIEPSEALIKLNDELYLYKEIYSKLISSLKKSQKSISKYEVMVSNLQNELIFHILKLTFDFFLNLILILNIFLYIKITHH